MCSSILPSSSGAGPRSGGVDRRALGLLVFLIFFVSFVGAPAFAQALSPPRGEGRDPAPEEDPSSEQLEQARTLFMEGKAKMSEGAWDEAAGLFSAALDIKDTPGLRYHVAFCREQAGRLLEARAHYEAARRLLQIRPAPDTEELLGPAFERVEEKLPELRITLSRPIEPSLVMVDGQVLEKWGVLRLDPGKHELRVVVPGREPIVMDIAIGPGARTLVQVPVGEPQAEPREPTVVHTSPSLRMPVVVTGAAVAVAGLAVGTWGLFDRAAALDEIEWAKSGMIRLSASGDSCSSATDSLRFACDDYEAALERRGRATGFAIGGFVASGVGASVTVAALLFWPDRPVQVNAVSTATHSGLQLTGRF